MSCSSQQRHFLSFKKSLDSKHYIKPWFTQSKWPGRACCSDCEKLTKEGIRLIQSPDDILCHSPWKWPQSCWTSHRKENLYDSSYPAKPNGTWLALLREKDSVLKGKQKKNLDRQHFVKSLPDLLPRDTVWLPSKKVEGTVIDKADTPWSYTAATSSAPAKEKQVPREPSPWNALRNGHYTMWRTLHLWEDQQPSVH